MYEAIRKLPLDIKIVLVLILLSIFFILVPLSMILKMLFALLLLLFVPGYALVSVLFPRREELAGIERFTLSIVLSIAITIFDGFMLNYTAWGFRTTSIVLSLSVFAAIMLLVAGIVRMRLPENERFCFDLSGLSARLRLDEKPTDIEKALMIALIISLCVAGGIIIYAKLTFPEEHFTSFYILGEGGKAENYTTDLYLGDKESTIVGIENHEGKAVNYTLKVLLGGSEVANREISLDDGKKKLEDVSFDVTRVGPKMKLEFLLFKELENEPYMTLHLWVASHIDFEHPEIIERYALSHVPRVNNSDFERETGWFFTQNNSHFRGLFYNATTKPAENSMIKGYVLDSETGLQIPYAQVSLSDHYDWGNQTKTNEYGFYEIKTIARHLWLECWSMGFDKSEEELDIAEGEESFVNVKLDVLPLYNVTIIPSPVEGEPPQVIVEELPVDKLPPGVVADVQGRIVDNVTDLPIANASVLFYRYGFEKSTNADRNGYFELSVLARSLTIRTGGKGYLENHTWINVSEKREIMIKLTPESSTIKGWVRDESGNPIQDVRIRVGDYIDPSRQTYYKTTMSNSSGYYEVTTIAGHFWLRAEKEDYFSNLKEFKVEYGAVKEINVKLRRLPEASSEVYGYVLCNDTGLSGVEVKLIEEGYEKTRLTNERGYYILEKVPEGRFLLFAESKVYSECVELNAKGGQRMRVDLKLGASLLNSFEISFPSQADSRYGDYGALYQDVYSEDEGIAVISFKVCDSYVSNKSRGYHFKQALLNEIVIWEDDVAGDEEWQEIKIPITLDKGKNRLTFRVYEKQGVGLFAVKVWYDDVRIEPLSEVTRETATSFHILDANGGVDYPTELYLGEPAEVIAVIENRAYEAVNYTLQVKLGGEVLKSENIRLEEGSKWEQRISFTPNLIGPLLKLEFLLFKNSVREVPYKEFHLWVSSDIDYDNLDVVKDYVASPLPEIENGDMESSGGWATENATNFTVRITDSASVSPVYSYETSYLGATPPNQGSYAVIYQNFTAEKYPAVVVISFSVRDSCTSDSEEGYYAKQALLNDRVIWEGDVAGDDNWQHVKVPVALTAAKNKLKLRLYAKGEGAELPIEVWWDDVKIEAITEIPEKATSSFYVLDVKGTEENYPTRLHLGEPAEVIVGIKNNEPEEVNYILQVKLDGRLLETRNKWVERGAIWEQKISFTPDIVGENQKLEFFLFKDRVTGKPYRRFYLGVSTDVNYNNLEPLLSYGIYPLPEIRDGDMSHISAWTPEYMGSSFIEGNPSEEYTSPPCSYCIKQYEKTNKGDYRELSQVFYVPNKGVVVISFDVRDSCAETSADAKNISKQVLLNDEVLWVDDLSGEDEGYVGWVREDYDWLLNRWVKRVPEVKSGWTHVDIPVYLWQGDNELKLRVYAKGGARKLPVKVYWDDVEIKALNELVDVEEGVRMRRYGW